MTIQVFKRTAKDWDEFIFARKVKIETTQTQEEARKICNKLNSKRTDKEVKKGTRYEFQTI